jgi:hypothetical protein
VIFGGTMRHFTDLAFKQVLHCLEHNFWSFLASLGYILGIILKFTAINLKDSAELNFLHDTIIFWNLFSLKKRPFFSIFFAKIFFWLFKYSFWHMKYNLGYIYLT